MIGSARIGQYAFNSQNYQLSPKRKKKAWSGFSSVTVLQAYWTAISVQEERGSQSLYVVSLSLWTGISRAEDWLIHASVQSFLLKISEPELHIQAIQMNTDIPCFLALWVPL